MNNAATGKKSADVGDYDYEDSGESSCGADYDYEDLTDEKYARTILKETSSTGEDWIISNVSPIDLGHSLLLPSVNLCQPQVSLSLLLASKSQLFAREMGLHSPARYCTSPLVEKYKVPPYLLVVFYRRSGSGISSESGSMVLMTKNLR